MLTILVRIGIAAKICGVCTKTLRRWEHNGRLQPALRTQGGHRRYETTLLLSAGKGANQSPPDPSDHPRPERVLGYIRVSSWRQKADLVRQRAQVEDYIRRKHWELDGIYEDIASGLNDRRPGLKQLLKVCQAGHIDRVVITYQDRLARFGTHLIEWILNRWGVQIESIEPVSLTPTIEEQLLKDLLALMTSFTGRFHRMRRRRKIRPERDKECQKEKKN